MKTTLLAIALVSLTGCVQRTTAPVADTRDADLKAIHDVEAAATKAWAAKNMDAILAQYASDGTMIVPGAPVAKGPEAMRGMLTELFKDPLAALELEVTVTEVSKSGDFGYQRGNYTLHATDGKTKKPMTEKGTYLSIYRKQADGSWKIIEDINAAGPAPQ